MALLLVVVLVAALLVAADFAARDATENAMASDVRRSTHAASASVVIDSFPFIYDAAAEGKLAQVTVTADGVPAGPLTLDEVQLVGHQVRFDRHELVSGRHVQITSVGSGTLTVVAHLSTLENELATRLDVQVTARGSGALAVTAEGRTVATVDLTKVALIPECPVTVTHTGSSYVLTCTVSPVPASVLAALSRPPAPPA